MPKKQQRNQHSKQRRALQKRTQRRQKLARRAVHEAAAGGPGGILRRAREYPIAGCWVQRDWQRYGVAVLAVARTQPSDEIVLGRFLVDTYCLGLKQTSFGVNIERTDFDSEVLPRLYQGEPPVSVTVEVAHEIVYGAIEYAESLGFRPHRHFRQSQRILDGPDAYPRSGAIEFGRDGQPTYIAGPYDNQRAVLNRLLENVGRGNFSYFPPGDPPEGLEDLVSEPDDQDLQSPIWIPGHDEGDGTVDEESGLWVPGQPEEAERRDEEPSRSSLWVPGR